MVQILKFLKKKNQKYLVNTIITDCCRLTEQARAQTNDYYFNYLNYSANFGVSCLLFSFKIEDYEVSNVINIRLKYNDLLFVLNYTA